MTRDADFKAVVRERARRRGVPYTQARREAIARGGRREPTTLHVTNGDSLAGTIRQMGVAGSVIAWRDVLHEGPVPVGTPAELRATRARYLSESSGTHFATALRELEQRDAQLASGFERYVLWFEADLYDQLQLIQVLDTLADGAVAPGQIELVSTGEFPGVAHFGGLGELGADALAGLYRQRVTLGAEAVALAQEAWTAFRAPEPTRLAALASVHSRELRFLGEAIGRLLQEYPWRGDGLSLTQRRILHAVDDPGTTAAEIFRRVWAREPRPYLGDSALFDYLRGLAGGAQPLVEIAGESDRFGERVVSLTEMGGFVLAGAIDVFTLGELDRWIGGVHLTGYAQWRYDPQRETVVPT